jgi:hypothetical protein
MSNLFWQDRGVKAKHGVLELWSKGVMEARDARPFCDAGPEAGVPTKPLKRPHMGKGGMEAGNWTGFSRLFPHESTQVVDFPHLAMVRHFLDANFANERELGKAKMNRRGAETQSQEEERNRWTMIIDIMDGMEEQGRSDAFAFWWQFSQRSVRLCSPMFA